MSEHFDDDLDEDFDYDTFDDYIDWDENDERELEELEKAQAKRFAEGKPLHSSGCKCAVETDEYHGWECEVTGGACVYLFPNSKACARELGEGPDVVGEGEDEV